MTVFVRVSSISNPYMVMRFLFSMLFICQLHMLVAQKVIIRREPETGFVYSGMDNPLTILAENLPCKSLSVKVSKGKITKTGDCTYIYHPDSAGAVVFRISAIKGQSVKLIDEITWYVRPVPEPSAVVGGYPNLSVIPVAAFKAQAGVGISSSSQYGVPCLTYSATKYALTIMRNDTVCFHSSCTGNAFCEEVKKGIRMLEAGDRILISNIHAVGADRKEMQLAPLEYCLK